MSPTLHAKFLLKQLDKLNTNIEDIAAAALYCADTKGTYCSGTRDEVLNSKNETLTVAYEKLWKMKHIIDNAIRRLE